jgi:hypothetical protein
MVAVVHGYTLNLTTAPIAAVYNSSADTRQMRHGTYFGTARTVACRPWRRSVFLNGFGFGFGLCAAHCRSRGAGGLAGLEPAPDAGYELVCTGEASGRDGAGAHGGCLA